MMGAARGSRITSANSVIKNSRIASPLRSMSMVCTTIGANTIVDIAARVLTGVAHRGITRNMHMEICELHGSQAARLNTYTGISNVKLIHLLVTCVAIMNVVKDTN